MNQNCLHTEISTGGIGIITFNRPERHNAFDDQMIEELITVLSLFEADTTVKVIVIAAEGKNFSAGADLAWMKKMVSYTAEENLADALQLVKLLQLLFKLAKPKLALVQGRAMGGALGILACCDIVLAEPNSQFCFSEAKLGLVPATITPYVITAIGTRAAEYYFLTAQTFSASTAQRLGLVHELVTDSVKSAGIKLAEKLLTNGPNAIVAIKKLVAQFKPNYNHLLKDTAELIALTRVSSEAQEGLKAFFEKRQPQWQTAVSKDN